MDNQYPDKNDLDSIWKKRFERERELRREAERLLEEKSLDLYRINQNLEVTAEELQQNNEELLTMVDFVNKQNTVIAKKNESIRKSMEVAQRIQKMVLPLPAELENFFSAYFLINKPKDIVSGDFFWVHERDGRKIIVVADCTGHGVPGAFMSVIGNALLNKIVIDNGVFLPDHILYYLNLFLCDFFRRSNNEIREGMDVSVCVYHEKTQKLRFAGAKSSMYCVNTESFSELKGDRKSVGGMQEKNEERLFTPSEVNVRSGTVFYMFTDGYRDQFGGENNRKYMSANFRNLLSSVHHLPVAEQEKVLLIAHNEWRAEREQTDDILLLGFRF